MFATDTAVGPDRCVRPAQPCSHRPPCPDAYAPDRDSAQILVGHPEQGWWLLCNGVVIFDDTGELLPSGRAIAPHRSVGPTTA
jgi:hypothetical protein